MPATEPWGNWERRQRVGGVFVGGQTPWGVTPSMTSQLAGVNRCSVAAITNCLRLWGLKRYTFRSHSSGPEVQRQGVCRTGPLWRLREESILSSPLPRGLLLLFTSTSSHLSRLLLLPCVSHSLTGDPLVSLISGPWVHSDNPELSPHLQTLDQICKIPFAYKATCSVSGD